MRIEYYNDWQHYNGRALLIAGDPYQLQIARNDDATASIIAIPYSGRGSAINILTLDNGTIDSIQEQLINNEKGGPSYEGA